MKNAALLALGASITLAGCGGSGASTHTSLATGATTGVRSASTILDAAARRALHQNYALSLYTLWHDRVPATAEQSTRGPALAGLRSSAEARRKRGIRVRVLDRHWMILSLRLDPSYTRATAVVQSQQHVRRYGSDGRPRGNATVLNERARIELHRLGDTARFIVWNVVVIK